VNADLASIMRQRGKVVTLLVICGTVVSLVHKDAAGSIFQGLALAVGALASMEAWSAAKGGGE
jgi:hypothetical protein